MSESLQRPSLASRLATLYAALLSIIVFLVIAASSIALVYELAGFTGDIIIAKHEEARALTAQYRMQGIGLPQSAPHIVHALSGIGLRVAVYDTKGHFLSGDQTLHPRILDRILQGRVEIPPPPDAQEHGDRTVLEPIRAPVAAASEKPVRIDPFALTAVDGGYVAFAPSPWLIFVNLIPYWRIIMVVAIVAIAIAWFIGRLFSRQALAPLTEVTGSLRALADGDYTQRRFVTAGGDEISRLTEAYNDAAAGVAAAMQARKNTEDRMRQFVADAGHELRTPLTVISGYIDVLRRGAIDEPKVARHILATMSLEKEHMRGLIDRLMRLARMDSETPPDRLPIDVAKLLNDQCEAARRLDEQRVVDCDVDGVSEILGDRAELGEALWNIVENALKYAPEAPVHLRASRHDGATVITVRDEGPGMTESERLHAFERFYRGDARGEIPGAGLGLAIAKRAVDRAGGTIAIESAPGRGTTVSITLSA